VKRLLLAVLLGLILMMTVGTSIVSAGAPPDAILVDPDNHSPQTPVIIKDNIKDGPPDILIKTPHGPKPKDDIPPH